MSEQEQIRSWALAMVRCADEAVRHWVHARRCRDTERCAAIHTAGVLRAEAFRLARAIVSVRTLSEPF